MKTFTVAILTFTILYSGCKTDNPTGLSGTTLKSGNVTFDTRRMSQGFSFSQGDTLSTPNSANIWPDFEFFIETGPDGPMALGVYLAGTYPNHNNRQTFHFKRSFSTLDSANTFFQSLTETTDTTFDPIISQLKAHQVYTIKTIDAKFAKILIRNNNLSNDSSYVTFSFDWVYQSDGTRHF
jgi:hypothetical protein